jgi:DNA-binding MarR family transcriptional regulator
MPRIRRDFTPEELRKCQELADLKKTRQEVADILGRCRGTIDGLAKKHGFKFAVSKKGPANIKYTPELWAKIDALEAKGYIQRDIADELELAPNSLYSAIVRRNKARGVDRKTRSQSMKDRIKVNPWYHEMLKQARRSGAKFTPAADAALAKYLSEWQNQILVEEFGGLILGHSPEAIGRRIIRLGLQEKGQKPCVRATRRSPQQSASPPARNPYAMSLQQATQRQTCSNVDLISCLAKTKQGASQAK